MTDETAFSPQIWASVRDGFLKHSEGVHSHLTNEEVFQYLEQRFELADDSAVRKRIYAASIECEQCGELLDWAVGLVSAMEETDLDAIQGGQRVTLASIFEGDSKDSKRTTEPILQFLTKALPEVETVDERFALAAQEQGTPGWGRELLFASKSLAAQVPLVFECEDLSIYVRLAEKAPFGEVQISGSSFKTVIVERGGKRRWIGDLDDLGLSAESTEDEIRDRFSQIEIKSV